MQNNRAASQLDALLALPETERAAEVRKASESDLELRADILARLKAAIDNAAQNDLDDDPRTEAIRRMRGMDDDDSWLVQEDVLAFLSATGPAQAVSPARPPGASLIGQTIDRYRVIRLVGEGGMGAVFLAERVDDFKMQVALKLIRGATQELVERFARERQILASMKHPGIAQLFDGGTTEDGTPYIAMEFIDGLHITRYAAVNQLSLAARLHLFACACDATAYAHQNLVIHRDIKPGNVLVDPHGQVKLLDFGLASLQDAPNGQALTVSTAMTPAYASPEQLTGARLTAASDQYSLGILLYELLTGSRPQWPGGDDGQSRGLPPRPSTQVTRPNPAATQPPLPPRQLASALAGDLDAIVLKALRPEPDQRYASVGELATDVRRYLAGQAVLASEPSRVYLLRKFVGRHRMEVIASGLFVLTLAIAAGVSFQAWRHERAALATASAARADEAKENQFLADMLQAPSAYQRGQNVRVIDVLEDAARTAPQALHDRPLVMAKVLSALGKTYAEIGDPSRAIPLQAQALQIYTQQLGADSHEALSVEWIWLEDRSFVEGHFKLLAESESYFARVAAKYPMRDPLYVDALTFLAAQYAEMPNETPPHPEMLGRARALAAQVLELDESVQGHDGEDTRGARNQLANLDMESGHYAQAEAEFREVIATEKRLKGSESHIAIALSSLAAALDHQRKHEDALAVVRESIAIKLRLQGEAHPGTLASMLIECRILHWLHRDADATNLMDHIAQLAGRRPETADVRADLAQLRALVTADLQKRQTADTTKAGA